MENILDEYNKQPLSKELYESIKWWEKRRILYNIAVGIAAIFPILRLCIFIESIDYIPFSLGIIVYLCLANICYCFGWGIDILKSFYFKNSTYGKHKSLLLVLGIVFSMLFTLLMF